MGGYVSKLGLTNIFGGRVLTVEKMLTKSHKNQIQADTFYELVIPTESTQIQHTNPYI